MGGMVDHHHLPLNPNDWSMHDNKDAFVFPPINHENLQIPSHQTIPNSPPSSLSSSSSSYSSSSLSSSSSSSSLPFDSQLRKGSDFIGWLSIGLQILRSKFLSTLSSFRNQRGAIWSFGVPTAALVMSCWVFVTMRKKKSKRRSLTANEARLINIIKEKDGKIAKLLHQIAEMNEILINRHKALAEKAVK